MIPTTPPLLILSDAILPMEGADTAIIGRAGVITHNGLILGVGTASDLRTKFGDLPEQYIPGVMLPGFINAHVHLELGYQRGKIPFPGHFTKWVAQLMQNYPAPEQLETVITQAVREGIAESLSFGVTCVGDISRRCSISRSALAKGNLHAVSFGEVVGLGRMRNVADQLLQTVEADNKSEWTTIAVSPHAPFTVEGPVLKKILTHALAKKMPVAMHLAEHPEEKDFLRDLSGPFGRDWDVMLKMNILDDAIPQMDGGPIRWAKHWGLLDAAHELPVILAHVNYAGAAELDLLANSPASVAYCPRTRAYFGHDATTKHPYREMLDAGINVCLGTDSLASNPDLSILREASFLWKRDRGNPYSLLEMITRRAAAALGMQADRGTLRTGKTADLIVLPIDPKNRTSTDVMTEILTQAPTPRAVWTRGTRI